MPIMTAHGQNDARIAAHLLATTAVECLRDPRVGPESEVALNNIYRLLEAFRLNPFFGTESPTRRNPHAAETLTFVQPMVRHVREVKHALDGALSAAFAGQSREQAIEEVEGVLRAVAYPQRYIRPSPQQVGRATQFFEEFLSRLKFV
jgi:hypothetical protein